MESIITSHNQYRNSCIITWSRIQEWKNLDVSVNREGCSNCRNPCRNCSITRKEIPLARLKIARQWILLSKIVYSHDYQASFYILCQIFHKLWNNLFLIHSRICSMLSYCYSKVTFLMFILDFENFATLYKIWHQILSLCCQIFIKIHYVVYFNYI